MNHKAIIFLLAASVLICFHPAEAQQPKKVPRIGYLSAFDPARESARSEAIWLALRERGYVEGPSDRIPKRGHRLRFELRAPRTVPAGSARAWLRGREEYRH